MSGNTVPRHDFYQTPTHLILSLYLKGYADKREDVKVDFEPSKIVLNLPYLPSASTSTAESAATGPHHITLQPLFSTVSPAECSYRVLTSKIELKLAKGASINWSSLLASANSSSSLSLNSSQPIASSSKTPITQPIDLSEGGSNSQKAALPNKTKKNWDKIIDDDEEEDGKDPNAGGDAALQKFFSGLYAGADEDTKRAMIKSFTESGGTTLSTDWNSIRKETTPVRPPEGMEARKYD